MPSSVCRVMTLLLGGLAGVLLCGHASAERPSATADAAYMAGLKIDRKMLAGPLAASPRSALRMDGATPEPAAETREVNLIGSGVVLEMARAGPDGRFVRPRLLIGRQSPELAFWMREAGLTPERCMLPMFRGRVKRDADTGKVGAALLVSARCTFF